MTAIATPCPRCLERSEHQICILHCDLGRFAFNIRKARVIVSDGRLPHAIPPEVVKKLLELNTDWDADHLDHINPDEPGIVAQRVNGLVLFDGVHRAARTLRDGTDFLAYMLNLREADSCIIVRDIAGVSTSVIVREIRIILGDNPDAEQIDIAIAIGPEEDPEEVKASIREQLAENENARIKLVVNENV